MSETMIAKITKAYVRHYRDNNQKVAYVEWIDHCGVAGRTEGPVLDNDNSKTLAAVYGDHISALMARAICTGHPIERETW